MLRNEASVLKPSRQYKIVQLFKPLPSPSRGEGQNGWTILYFKSVLAQIPPSLE